MGKQISYDNQQWAFLEKGTKIAKVFSQAKKEKK